MNTIVPPKQLYFSYPEIRQGDLRNLFIQRRKRNSLRFSFGKSAPKHFLKAGTKFFESKIEPKEKGQ